MAVTITVKRSHMFKFTNGTEEVSTASLAGTYVQGGFAFNCANLVGTPGTSPLGGMPLVADWYSPNGYIYVSTFAGQVMTTKILSAPGTELAAGALPDATVPLLITRRLV